MYRPTPGPSTALYQLPPTPPSTPLGSSSYDGMDDVLPALIAFDLDYTLWSGWMDRHYSGPLRRQTSTTLNQLLDGNDKRLSLYPQVSQILHRLQESQTHIAAISRTSAPELARDALALLLVPPPPSRPRERPQRAIDFFESMEIYPDSKLVHFSELHQTTQIPYSSMLFFAGDTSDYASNLEVQKLGVTFVPVVDHEKGLTERRFEEGIKVWRERRRERALLTLTVPGVDDGCGSGGRRAGMMGGRRLQQQQQQQEEKRDERMARRPVPPHSHHSESRQQQHQQQARQQQQVHQSQPQQQPQQQRTTPHRTHPPRPLQLQHRWNSESRQWEIVNTQQHYSSLRSPTSPSTPTSNTTPVKERPWTADPVRLSPWSAAGETHWVRAESEPPVSLHHHHHHGHHHGLDQHASSSPGHAAQLQAGGFEKVRGVWTPPMSVSSPEMDEEDEEDDDEDDDDESSDASQGSQGSGSPPSSW